MRMLLDLEIAEERSLEGLDVKAAAPSGWVKITHICKTHPMPVWRVTTARHQLECAAKHLVITLFQGPVPADRLLPGDLIETESGPEAVIKSFFTGDTRPLFDLRVDSPDHVYYTDGIASHNSTGLGAAELFKLNVVNNYRSLYLAPLKEHIKTFADKLMDMQRGSVFPPEYILSKGLRNNMYYKESPKGGFLKLLHVLTDVSKVRGNSCGSVVVDEVQDFDPDHLPEIRQVQKAFPDSKSTIFAGTSKDMDTCLQHQYSIGSRGVWHVRCDCPDKWHPLNDVELIPKLMAVDGIRCPHSRRLLNPFNGEFVHEDSRMLELNQVSFHLPQIIVPEYATGNAFLQIWKDFKSYPFNKFLQEVMGIAVDAGYSEITEQDLRRCCSDRTFAQIQKDFFSGKTRYVKLFSGCDWGGSDWNRATKTKQSYTVHTIYGMLGDGRMELIYAYRYAGQHYQDIAGQIVAAHNKFKTFAIGTDQGGGSYYNAYLRDCGRIQTDRIISFQYTDTKLVLERIPHPDANVMSLHRTDSISALFNDIKSQKIIFPRWDECEGFVTDFLNTRRNLTETQTGRSIMRYIRAGAKADDFMQSTNYAVMMKRIVTRESVIPNQQILTELAQMFGMAPIQTSVASAMTHMGGYFNG